MKHKPTKKEYSDFKLRFRSQMQALGYDKLTRVEAGEKIGFSGGAVSYWWNGQRIPLHDAAVKLANALHCNVNWLINGIDEPSLPEDKKTITADQAAAIQLLIEVFKENNAKAPQQYNRRDGDRRQNKSCTSR
jgi:transcriptional regulator with XRE-family HTH domain